MILCVYRLTFVPLRCGAEEDAGAPADAARPGEDSAAGAPAHGARDAGTADHGGKRNTQRKSPIKSTQIASISSGPPWV